ncbi:MAG: tRNA (adenosine(37)-N6)-dimethylallyltransferase MiaA [Oscillospiraceae bacterium]|jgi:tRNA dimethylallyltransferase|nr:tRNA (adenosine(37)-N6)-dimethylallyltransferase MiaA [Oscillospiraceae bacterium]MDD3261732.1 tRNA (adenosine(37)-N6)-dimethylallyltransferase MiaA [Oscillospiraceae bacterium]
MKKISVAVVAGPTASGKTRLAVALCRALHGEVVSADSMQIYRGMQIATAKPTPAEMQGVPHHLIDFQPPQQAFSVADYVQLAGEAIQQIAAAGRLPVIAGGTGLYIRSLLQGISFEQPNADPAVRADLQKYADEKGGQALYERLKQIDPQAAASIHPNNTKRVIRVLEIYQTTGKTLAENEALSHGQASPYSACMLCLGFRDRAKLYERINTRVDQMIDAGLVQEAEQALRSGGATSLQAIGYKELLPYLQGRCTLPQAVESVKRETRRYAKRQLTWFRREKDARWLYVDDYPDFFALAQQAENLIRNFLKGGSL